ncbi:MAG: flavin reductase family protein [Ignisphaera sp.]|nr:flavin reductase family protein [Ignisphaera sp.]MCX8167418.1 flavin reductase family protein [Ignisphaera sp.]MDW8085926.1 flavin reductase family protein [Ignisphaera sp.]
MNAEEVKPKRFYYILHPRPVVVIITRCANGKINAMSASWITPVSEDHPTIAVAIDRTSFTHECLEYSGEATINIPSFIHADLVYKIGTSSGREIDKIERFRITLIGSKKISTPRWSEAVGWLEVKVDRYIDIGEVRLYVFNVVESYMRKDVAGEWGWDTRKASILHHGVGRAFYTVGRVLLAG